MTELDLYKFVEKHDIEYHWHDKDVVMFVDIDDISEFNDLLGLTSMDDGGIECHMKLGYFCFNMEGICNYFDIEMKNVFTKQG